MPHKFLTYEKCRHLSAKHANWITGRLNGIENLRKLQNQDNLSINDTDQKQITAFLEPITFQTPDMIEDLTGGWDAFLQSNF